MICVDTKRTEEFDILHSGCAGPRAVCTTCVRKHAEAEVTGKMSVRVACPLGGSICNGQLTDEDLARFGCNDIASLLANNQIRAWTAQQVGCSL